MVEILVAEGSTIDVGAEVCIIEQALDDGVPSIADPSTTTASRVPPPPEGPVVRSPVRSSGSTGAPLPPLPGETSVRHGAEEGGVIEHFSRIRAATAQVMSTSASTIPHVLSVVEADYSAVASARHRWPTDRRRPTPLAFVTKAVAEALQRYVPVDASLMLTYREATDGQILEEGITEAGAVAAFQAAGTSHVTSGVATIPFYLFYSMFGFQRTGDSIWQLGDARARGFLLGGTAGRTTLLGEGLQHQDGTSQLFAAAYPYVRAYDPAFAYETAAIVERGISEMFGKEQADVTYYLTLSNEPLHQPAKPAGADEGILAGLYLFRTATPKSQQATILFSGSIAGEALAAAEILEEEHDVGVALYSVTSYKEIRHEAMHATRAGRQSYVAEVLDGAPGPLVAVTDYVTHRADADRWLHRSTAAGARNRWRRHVRL